GAGQIATLIEPLIEKAGGKIYISAAVSNIIVKDNKAIGVKMADGKEIFAPLVVSNAGFVNTFSKLLPEELIRKHGYFEKMKMTEPSASHISLYIGLKHTAEELNLPKSNYWVYPDNYDHDANMGNYLKSPDTAPLPVAYISFPAAKDPDFLNRFPGRATIEVIGFAPYDWFKKWEGTKW